MKGTFIYVLKKRRFPYMDFYLLDQGKSTYLFTMPYRKNVYHFFEKGKSINQLYKFKRGKKKDTLTRLIENRIPHEMKRVRREMESDEGKRKISYICSKNDRCMEYLA